MWCRVCLQECTATEGESHCCMGTAFDTKEEMEAEIAAYPANNDL